MVPAPIPPARDRRRSVPDRRAALRGAPSRRGRSLARQADGPRLGCRASIGLRGEIVLASGGTPADAEEHFQRALEIARSQEARSYELRAATRLARLWRDQRKPSEARALLQTVYDWFTEGFDTPDLKDAKALLEELGR
jgi:predicted ATPase